MAAADEKEKAVAEAAMAGFEHSPPAVRPAPPAAPARARLQGAPSFAEHAAELEELQTVGRRLQDMASAGRRLTHAATSRLQHADLAGAAAVLQEMATLPSPREVMGEALWQDPQRRLRLCESNQVGWFIEGRLACLSLLSFLERGVLTPEVPVACRLDIEDQDDERYLLGIIDAVRELERYAVNRGQVLDLPSLRLCLAAVQCLEQALMQFDFRNSDLRRKFDGVKYSVRKFENMVYEVELALQRAAATAALSAAPAPGGAGAGEPQPATASVEAPAAPAAPAAEGPVGALDLPTLAQIKVRYDKFDASRELVIKRSRDVIKGAKNAVYALQRSDFRKADETLRQCAKDACAIFKELVHESPTLRNGLFSASLEEMAEAVAYRAFRKDKRVLSRTEMQAESGLDFPLALHEYLGGLFDLTGEVGRHAIRSASRGRQAAQDVELCFACVDAVYTGAQELPYLPMGLGKKMGALRGTLGKIEGALYELALLSQGLRVQAPALGGAGDDDQPEEEEAGAVSRM